jgi:DNA-directed RNA polymerase specialized sigma24 family protein
MRRVREGSAEALDQITRCYGVRLLEAGRGHCRTTTEAEDAVQDALITAGSELHDLLDDASLPGWLIKVVASACRHIGRGHKNDGTRHDSEIELELAANGTPDPEQAAASVS